MAMRAAFCSDICQAQTLTLASSSVENSATALNLHRAVSTSYTF
jgi:hypothetical protein